MGLVAGVTVGLVVGVSAGAVVGPSVGVMVGPSVGACVPSVVPSVVCCVLSVVAWLGVLLGLVFCVSFLPQAHRLSSITSTRSKDDAFFIVVPCLSIR